MTLPTVKVACIAAVMQKAMHTDTMGGWAIDWLSEFCKKQPHLASHVCMWLEHYPDMDEEVLTGLTAMIGILVKSIESQIEADELVKGLG